MRAVAERRFNTELKIEHKSEIIKNTWHVSDEHYFKSQKHRLAKGKVHCSCPMCSAKTNTKITRYRSGYALSDVKRLIKESEGNYEFRFKKLNRFKTRCLQVHQDFRQYNS